MADNYIRLGREFPPKQRRALQRALLGPKVVSAGRVTTDGDASTGTTLNLSNYTSEIVNVVAAVIDGFTTLPAGELRKLRFGSGTQLNNSSAFILPGNVAYIVTESGDIAEFYSLGDDGWLCYNYTRAGRSPTTFAHSPASAKVATTTTLAAYTIDAAAPQSITFSANGTQAIDGHTMAAGEIVLVKDETAGNQPNNGLYQVAVAGDGSTQAVWTRHRDLWAGDQFPYAMIFVESGTTNAKTLWVYSGIVASLAGPTVGTDTIAFSGVNNATGIQTLNGLSDHAQTFARVNDTNITMTIGSVSPTHTFTLAWAGVLGVARGGTTISSCAQGDLIYSPGTNQFNALPKDTNATRYLSNTGLNNNPAWAQINLANGVTGVLPFANLTNASAASVLLGRGSAAGAGVYQEITLSGLSMSGTVLTATPFSITDLSAVDPALADESPFYDVSDTTNAKATLSKLLGQSCTSLCEGRLTLTSGTAVTTTNVTGATNIYFTPYNGDRITIYDGTRLLLYSFTELTLPLGTLVNAQAYDIFIYDSSGTLTLESLEWHNATVTMTTASPCVVTWTAHGMVTGNSITFTTTGALPTGLSANTQYFVTKIDANTFKVSTTRANVAAATFVNTTVNGSGTHTGHDPQHRNTALVAQNGALYKTGALTRRYLGTFFTTATTTTEDSTTNRFLWNYSNRLQRLMYVTESTDSWTYTLATWRQANGADGNRVNFIIGVSEDLVSAKVYVDGRNSGSSNSFAAGVGIDTTSANNAQIFPGISNAGSNSGAALTTDYTGYPGIGYHAAIWLEISVASNTTTWYGDNGLTYIQSGMIATILG